jgi:hypothetical protein
MEVPMRALLLSLLIAAPASAMAGSFSPADLARQIDPSGTQAVIATAPTAGQAAAPVMVASLASLTSPFRGSLTEAAATQGETRVSSFGPADLARLRGPLGGTVSVTVLAAR